MALETLRTRASAHTTEGKEVIKLKPYYINGRRGNMPVLADCLSDSKEDALWQFMHHPQLMGVKLNQRTLREGPPRRTRKKVK